MLIIWESYVIQLWYVFPISVKLNRVVRIVQVPQHPLEQPWRFRSGFLGVQVNFLNLFFTISSRLAFKACISSSKSQSTTKRHQANAMYTPLRSRYIMILSAPPFATDTEVQSNRTVICGLATSPHGPPFLHRNQSMWKSHQITSKSFLCSFAGSKSSSWQFFSHKSG